MLSGPAVVPPTTDPRWFALVTRGTRKPLNALALQLILKCVNWQASLDPSPANVTEKIEQLARFFEQNSRLLEVDAVTLFG
jgi:hypothetical protein